MKSIEFFGVAIKTSETGLWVLHSGRGPRDLIWVADNNLDFRFDGALDENLRSSSKGVKISIEQGTKIRRLVTHTRDGLRIIEFLETQIACIHEETDCFGGVRVCLECEEALGTCVGT